MQKRKKKRKAETNPDESPPTSKQPKWLNDCPDDSLSPSLEEPLETMVTIETHDVEVEMPLLEQVTTGEQVTEVVEVENLLVISQCDTCSKTYGEDLFESVEMVDAGVQTDPQEPSVSSGPSVFQELDYVPVAGLTNIVNQARSAAEKEKEFARLFMAYLRERQKKFSKEPSGAEP